MSGSNPTFEQRAEKESFKIFGLKSVSLFNEPISQDIIRDEIFGYRYMVNISWIVLIVTLHFPYIWMTVYWRQIEIWAPYDMVSILIFRYALLGSFFVHTNEILSPLFNDE